RGGRARAPGVLRDPVSRLFSTFINAGLVLANSHRESAISAAGESVAHKTFDRAQQPFHVCRMLLQQIKQLFCAFSGIRSYNRLHVSLPPFSRPHPPYRRYPPPLIFPFCSHLANI